MHQKLINLYNSLNKNQTSQSDWLDDLNYSQAFMVCVGAGPWKIERRQKIQTAALKWLGKYDLADCTNSANCFPLDWQRKTTEHLVQSLCAFKVSMKYYCKYYLAYNKADDQRTIFYRDCGSPNGTKVLSLFCRDKLKIDAFPIDRHVKRILKENHLPTKERDIINLCREANLDPKKVATTFVKSAGVENPDWKFLIKEI